MDTLVVEKKGPVATIWLNRPELRNAFNERMIEELTTIFKGLPDDEETRVLILAGKGKVFSAGADLNWMKSMVKASREENYRDARRLADLLQLIDTCPKVTIARIQGAALGGGMGLAAVCDLVVAEEEAQFGFTEVRLGLIPAVISPFVIKKIGPSWTRRSFLTGERFCAKAAQDVGLVHHLAKVDELDLQVQKFADEALQAGPQAIKECKKLLARITPIATGDLLKETAEWIARLRVSPEGQEGTTAFLEKRKPKWVS